MVLSSMKKSIALIKSKGQKYYVEQESVDIMHHKTPNDYDVAKPIAKPHFCAKLIDHNFRSYIVKLFINAKYQTLPGRNMQVLS